MTRRRDDRHRVHTASWDIPGAMVTRLFGHKQVALRREHVVNMDVEEVAARVVVRICGFHDDK